MSRPKDIQLMKDELKTLALFDSVGNPGRVAMRYGIDHADAFKWRKELEAKERESAKSMGSASEARMKENIRSIADFTAAGGIRGVVQTYRCNIKRVSDYYKELAQKEQANPAPSPASLPSDESKVVPESDSTPEVITTPPEPNLNEREKFFEEPQPDLSAVAGIVAVGPVVPESKPKFLKFESSKELALELVAKVTAEVTLQVKSELEQRVKIYFEQANKALAELGQTENRVDQLINEIRVEFLGIVERELGVALNGVGECK